MEDDLIFIDDEEANQNRTVNLKSSVNPIIMRERSPENVQTEPKRYSAKKDRPT